MPSTKIVNQATSANAMAGLNFEDIPPQGALLSLYASGVTAGDTISCTAAGEQLAVDAEPNIEIGADVVDTSRDRILFQEPVSEGKVFIPVTATTAINWLLVVEYAAAA